MQITRLSFIELNGLIVISRGRDVRRRILRGELTPFFARKFAVVRSVRRRLDISLADDAGAHDDDERS